jgi:hypothetical protein
MIPTGEKSAYYFSQMTQSQNSASQSSQPILPPNPVVVHAALAAIMADHNSSDSNVDDSMSVEVEAENKYSNKEAIIQDGSFNEDVIEEYYYTTLFLVSQEASSKTGKGRVRISNRIFSYQFPPFRFCYYSYYYSYYYFYY